MTTRIALIASATLAGSLISGAAHADLQGRDLDGYTATTEAYYDSDLNITWLIDAHVNVGYMSWADANTWAANLSIVDNINHITYDKWRLPTILQPDASCSDQSTGGHLLDTAALAVKWAIFFTVSWVVRPVSLF